MCVYVGGGRGGAMATTPPFETILTSVSGHTYESSVFPAWGGGGVGVADTSRARSKFSEDGVQSLSVSSRSIPLLQVYSESADRRLPPTWVEL